MYRFAALMLIVTSWPGLFGQKPEKHFEYGFEQRVRNENWNNIFDFSDSSDDERRQIRYRTRLWMNTSLTSNIDLSIGAVSESN